MSRSKRFISGLVSSYATIGVNVAYTLASVPLALHYLSKEEFGLWAVVTQLTGYLMLLEFGMIGSVSRFLTDHKDDIDGGPYGSILKTGARVFLIQGLLVTFAGMGVALIAPELLNLSTGLRSTFTLLMALQAALTGCKLATGSLSSPLWSHQRLDISNLAGCVSLIINFACLWLGFHLGWKVYSLVAATGLGFFASLAVCYISCRRLHLYPSAAGQGKFDTRLFRELFSFGGGLFLMNLGAQLASASQVIIVSRLLGMEAAAVWSVATKIFSLAQQFVARVLDSSAGGLAEMVARRESAQLQKRFRHLVSISAVMAVAASAGIALANGAFIELWTSGRVTWEPWNNFLLACVLFSTAATRCHTSLVGITKQIRGMKFVYLFEGIAFVVLSLLLVPRLELAGLLISALICNIGVTGTYGIIRTAGYFGLSRLAVTGWVTRPTGILMITAGLFALTRVPALAGLDTPLRFVMGIMAFSVLVMPTMWFFGMDPGLRYEIVSLATRIRGKTSAFCRDT